MSIAVTCSACQASFKVKDEYAGRRGKCPQCKTVVQVPGVAAASSSQPSPPAPGASNDSPHGVAGLSPLDIGEDFSAPLGPRPAVRRSSSAAAGRNSGAHTSGTPKFNIPIWAWGAGVAVVLLLAVGATIVATLAMQNNKHGKSVADGRGRQPTAVKSNPAPFNPDAGKTIALKNKPQSGAPLEDIVDYVKHSIVKIETSDAFNRRTGLGSGFIIDAAGLVATNYHVVSEAVKAEVVFNDGTRYGVEGYVALNPQTDLCVLKLNGVPPNVKALQLVTGSGPRPASSVYAIGHPQNHEFTTTGGIVGKVVHTAQLPADTRAWLKGSLQGEPDNTWIQHDAKISPGNSGGPLINSAGDVLGVNSWINPEVGFGYAIHSQHLQDLINGRSTTVTALRDKRRKSEESPPEQLTMASFSSERMQKLAAELSAKQWKPTGAEDCASFDSLAWGVTLIRLMQDGADFGPIPAQERAAMFSVADQIVNTLRKVQWHDNDQILPINEHASRPHQAKEGTFLFGVLKQRVDLGNQGKGWLIELKGRNKIYFIPSDARNAEFKDGDCALVMGIAIPDHIQLGDNQSKPIRAQVLLSNAMLKVSDGPGGMLEQPIPGAAMGNSTRPNAGFPGSRPRPGSRRPGSIPRGTN